MKLSKNFTLKEFTRSRTAKKHGIPNNPPPKAVENIKKLVKAILQPLREKINAPIFVDSGYRSKLLNAMLGGSFRSQHMEGKAADIVSFSVPVKELFRIIYENFEFDQLIYEFGEWIHVSYNEGRNRKQALIAKKIKGETVYEEFTGNFEELE